MKKKILITGCSGFLATNLINKLVKKKNFKIHALSKKKLEYSQKIIKKNIRFIHCDITNYSKLKKKIDKNYSMVLNFAGNINHKNKIQTYKAHYSGLKNLIKCINVDKIKLFLQIGSSMEYGFHESPHSEELFCKPKSYYGRAKYLASSYISKKVKNYIILRLYQVYGPHQKNNRLIPIVVNSCLEKKSFNCTDGKQVRDFLYVDDFINLILKIIKKKKIMSGVYNVGAGRPIKVKKVINLIKRAVGSGRPLFGSLKIRKDELKISYPKINKIKKIFNWRPKINLRDGVYKTIKYYEKFSR